MAFVVDIAFRGAEADRRDLAGAHRAYWGRMAACGVLLGGGPWRDGTGELLICAVRDRRTLLRVLRADPYARARVVGEPRIREWDAVTGRAVLAGPERSTGGPGTREDTSASAPPPVRTALTAHERRIAAMMLDGLTNRQIAEALTVSTRAVELHITRLYRKLGIRRRAQLAFAVDRPVPTAESPRQGRSVSTAQPPRQDRPAAPVYDSR
ncbi:LuxR C-terminal-related transcriptional regulator [Streptomyces sp. cmx-10-25]|uniref:LuxR C-terminal-related transcriptional regulator n=1 Tax=Streptomyces sp. cmx-10-25 TaxID=2790919 RepID=UPI00398043B9